MKMAKNAILLDTNELTIEEMKQKTHWIEKEIDILRKSIIIS